MGAGRSLPVHAGCQAKRIFVELMTSDRNHARVVEGGKTLQNRGYPRFRQDDETSNSGRISSKVDILYHFL
jgi:hypothetical protein